MKYGITIAIVYCIISSSLYQDHTLQAQDKKNSIRNDELTGKIQYKVRKKNRKKESKKINKPTGDFTVKKQNTKTFVQVSKYTGNKLELKNKGKPGAKVQKISNYQGGNRVSNSTPPNVKKQINNTGMQKIERNKSKPRQINSPGNIVVRKDKPGSKSQKLNYTAVRKDRTKPANKNLNYSGDILVRKDHKKGELNNLNSSGNILVKKRDNSKLSQKKMNTYSGDIVVKRSSDQSHVSGTKAFASYQGEIIVKRNNDRNLESKSANYSGDISVSVLYKREKQWKDDSKKTANYGGDILVKTLKDRDRRARNISKKINSYEGDIIIRRREQKGDIYHDMYLAQKYQGGTVINSYTRKEKYRQKMLRKLAKKNELEMPEYQKQKYKQPRYMKDEYLIWND